MPPVRAADARPAHKIAECASAVKQVWERYGSAHQERPLSTLKNGLCLVSENPCVGSSTLPLTTAKNPLFPAGFAVS